MEINYQKVGWDTTKYFNPTNMNHMDDGIKAACDKSDANEVAIADVNSNLLIKGYIDKNIGDVQLNSYGYLDIRDHMPTNKTVVLAGIKTFGASASAWGFNITVDGSYIIGAGGDSISNLTIRYYYS